MFLQLAASGKHFEKCTVFCLSANSEIATMFLHIVLIYSSVMLFNKEVTDLTVTDVKVFEGTMYLTKCAQHLAELDFSMLLNLFIASVYLDSGGS